MHIAFISYEYPPETPNGGIATYVQQAARMLCGRGHDVEIFAGSPTRDAVIEVHGLRVHRVHVAQRTDFARRVAGVYASRHRAAPFDVVEGPDYDADARFAMARTPDVPLVTRLHTPAYLAAILNDASTVYAEPGGADAATGAEEELPRSVPRPSSGYDRNGDIAYRHVLDADAITAPSHAIRNVVCRDWELDAADVDVYPNVYQPAPALLNLPGEINSRVVLYLGRLEHRKGVLDLAGAAPLILQACPDVRFRFVGRALASPDPTLDMRGYLGRLLAPYAHAVRVESHVPLDQVSSVLGEAEVCVFPSLWENFPGVCLEAMASARGIVGSASGGMAGMLRDNSGLLVPPHSPARIAQAVLRLLEYPLEREQMGARARARVQALYNADQIGPRQEASYLRAIRHRREIGPRSSNEAEDSRK